MIIGIDAYNIGSGGGINHLKNFLQHSIKEACTKKIYVICKRDSLSELPKDKLIFYKTFRFNYSTIISFAIQPLLHDSYFKKKKCNILFVPGGIYLGFFSPKVTMSQNFLPFDSNEIKRFVSSFSKFKFKLIKLLQLYTFNRSEGIIFLNDYPKKIISKSLKVNKRSCVIPHGIKKQDYEYSNKKIKNLLYVSDINAYKNQWVLAKAILELARENINLHLSLVGQLKNPYAKYLNNLKRDYLYFDKHITLVGEVSPYEVEAYLKNTDCFIYLSTCENLPISLLESMSFGLPIITTNKEPMTSVVPIQNVFVDPTNINSIKKGIKLMLSIKNLNKISKINKSESLKYNWSESSGKTIDFFKEIILPNNQHSQN